VTKPPSVTLRLAASFHRIAKHATIHEILNSHAAEPRARRFNRAILVHFSGCDGVHSSCASRDVTDVEAGMRLTGLRIIPSEFSSFDNFRSMRPCRLI
jgi:hypothetical protein